MKIKWNEFLIFLNLLILLTIQIDCYDTDSSASIYTKSSAVVAGEDVIFTWENVEKYDIDPKIFFWDYSSSPFIDKNFIEGSWSYLNEQSNLNPSTANPTGQVKVKAPNEEGLYKIFYCFRRYREFKCNYIRNLSVITCGAKNFQKMKQIIELGKHTHKSNEIIIKIKVSRNIGIVVLQQIIRLQIHRQLKILQTKISIKTMKRK